MGRLNEVLTPAPVVISLTLAPRSVTELLIFRRKFDPFDELNNNNANNTAALAGIGGTDAGGAKMWIFK